MNKQAMKEMFFACLIVLAMIYATSCVSTIDQSMAYSLIQGE